MRILIIRFSSIGDIVLTTPVVRSLKKQLEAEVHFLTKKGFASLLESNPYIDKIHTINKQVKEVLPTLKSLDFDYIIDLHKNLRSLQVRHALSAKVLTFNKLNVEKWLLVNLKINRMPKVHIVNRYLEAAEPLGVKNDGEGLDYFIPEGTILPENLAKKYIAFAIGGAHATKRLPLDKIVEICQQIALPIVLLGGKEDVKVAEEVANNISNITNLCGKISLHQSALVAQYATQIITHDTGMMHIAAALRKPIISIWGNTVPEFGMYPYTTDNSDFQSENTIAEVKDLSCRPCSKIGYEKCPKGHFKCMQLIDIEAIIKNIHSA